MHHFWQKQYSFWPSSCFHHSEACLAYVTDTVSSNTPLISAPFFHKPRPLMTWWTTPEPRTLLDGLAVAVPLRRMTQRRHYASLCLSRSLPLYCCCCHKDQLRNVYINSNAHWGWGCKTKQHRLWKSCRCAARRGLTAVYSLVSLATTCAALLRNAWIWFDLLCWVCQSVGHSWIGQCGE